MPIKIALKKESNSTKFTTVFHNFSVAGLCFIYTSQINCIDLFLTYCILHCYISENFVSPVTTTIIFGVSGAKRLFQGL